MKCGLSKRHWRDEKDCVYQKQLEEAAASSERDDEKREWIELDVNEEPQSEAWSSISASLRPHQNFGYGACFPFDLGIVLCCFSCSLSLSLSLFFFFFALRMKLWA